ncbi:MAG TPA: activase [Verrucomicrobia bacterium]|nr:activase [Verrucomicrobiota bacterium]
MQTEAYRKEEGAAGHSVAEGRQRALGLCLGASTISAVVLDASTDGGKPRIAHSARFPHDGDPRATLRRMFEDLDMASFKHIVATGRNLRKAMRFTSIPEPEAVELAYRFIDKPECRTSAVVSAGGETFMAYVFDGRGQIANVLTGNKCASGTGEFFLQQLRRMDVSLDEAALWAGVETPYNVSGRCSVFCKSDCTHATNKGVPKQRVTAGLCRMMAGKIVELLKGVGADGVMVVGGASQNRMMIDYLREAIPSLTVPPEAPIFEALGAALRALEQPTATFETANDIFHPDACGLETLPPLRNYLDQVAFKTMTKDAAKSGDACILGLDVGSTTTKAVLLRHADNAMLASIYLRTNGNPVGAARACYRAIADAVAKSADPASLAITGLGVCGSGRQIAGLHALTDGVINEIIAHATAAVHFDPGVDTIFEIGGQDAKYTYITNGVPSDYAMNEACSAGTGSFLEESALESLGIRTEDIGKIAVEGERPPNFSDQCAAFISSDIKNAIHEGVGRADIVAGLVYSICMNYTNRVKGNRPVGEKIFMQGGVCYNHAVPLAMAALVGKPIVVPPEPGLMGAFGVALEVKKRIAAGLMAPGHFELADLAAREVAFDEPFICKGAGDGCDRRCEIARVVVNGVKYPFGGACNLYYNIRHRIKRDTSHLDLVKVRRRIVFSAPAEDAALLGQPSAASRRRIGFNRSFLVNTYYPLYASFFRQLGYDPVLPEKPSREGIDHKNASFCFPAELAHGFFHSLIDAPEPPDAIFLPHFKSTPTLEEGVQSEVCPLVQGETFYLRTAFREQLSTLEARGVKLLTPMMDLHEGVAAAESELVACALELGIPQAQARHAFLVAAADHHARQQAMRAEGRKALAELEANPDQLGVVIFSRPYSGLADEANMGIPHKFASRGIMVIPMDFLPLENEPSRDHMYWGLGQYLLKAAHVVERHPQLFGVYITNFSCGPDSFLITYFREIMGRKPSLTLELDSHTADAGLEIRVEAFLDIATAYRRLVVGEVAAAAEFHAAKLSFDARDKAMVKTSGGTTVPLSDPRVTLLIPSMGELGTDMIAAAFRSQGLKAIAHPPADEAILKLGRANTSCKECLPLILTAGMLLNYVRHLRAPDEIVVYFMPTGSGPCRFGQYHMFMEHLVDRLSIPDVAMLSLSSENSYAGMSSGFHARAWRGIVISDVMEDVRSMLLANAVDRSAAMETFHAGYRRLVDAVATGKNKRLNNELANVSRELAAIPLKRPCSEVPLISLTGEIYVRRDGLSRQTLTERLAEHGFAVICTPVTEWMHYTDYLLSRGMSDHVLSITGRLGYLARRLFMTNEERGIKKTLASSGLTKPHAISIPKLVAKAAPHISENLTGEAVLTVGGALADIATHVCGVIAIGPFGCMPNRLAESILNEVMNSDDKLAAEPENPALRAVLSDIDNLPFLAIESDGAPFPQLIATKLETFLLRAERLHRKMQVPKRAH